VHKKSGGKGDKKIKKIMVGKRDDKKTT